MVPALLAKIGIPVLARILGSSLRRIDDPAAKGAAKALDILDNALTTGRISPEQMAEANRHTEKMAEVRFKEFEVSLSEINKSLRAEIASQDVYVRRMRPTFGYLMAFTWAAQMFALAYVIVFQTNKAHLVLQAMESLGTIWAVGLSVLGIYVYKRSEDKKLGL